MAVLPILMSGWGAPAVPDIAGDGGRDPAAVVDAAGTGAPVVAGLTCPSPVRGRGTIDYMTSTGGQATPERAARAFARPANEIVVAENTGSRAGGYLLRADSTAYTRLDLVRLRDGTWRVEGLESCSGEAPFA